MAEQALIPIELLRQLLRYDPETGQITRAVGSRWKPAFTASDSDGYKVGSVAGRQVKAHRVAWALHHGEWPKMEIDHINGDRSDNRLANLREAHRWQNGQNMAIRKTNTSGHPGVSWHSGRGKWKAAIRANGTRHYLGYFDCPAEAGTAYADAKRRLHSFAPEIRRS